MGRTAGFLTAVLAGGGLQVALFVTGFAHPVVLVGSLLVTVAAVEATVRYVRRVRGSGGAERKAWACLAFSLLMWVGACALHLVDAFAGIDRPPPRPADMFSAASVLLIPVALLAGPGAPVSWGVRLRLALDGAMVAVALFIPAWPFLLRPSSEVMGQTGDVLGVALPSVHIINLSIAIVLLSRQRTSRTTAFTLLAAAFGVLACCALVYTGVTVYGGTWRLTAVSGLFLIATVVLSAASRFDMPADARPWSGVPTGWRAALPYLPVLAAFALGAAQGGGHDDVLLAALLLLVALVLARQFLALRTNAQLLAEVESQREQLVHQATHDDLTGLSNRKLLHRHASEVLGAGHPVGLMLLDLDGFKQVNDRNGHAAGDAVLVEVAAVLRAEALPGHTVARLGGDEFAMLLYPAPAVAEALAAGVRIIAAVRAGPEKVGASIGIAYEPSGQATLGMLLSDADAALYRAKNEGKGRVKLTLRALAELEAQDHASVVGDAGAAVQR